MRRKKRINSSRVRKNISRIKTGMRSLIMQTKTVRITFMAVKRETMIHRLRFNAVLRLRCSLSMTTPLISFLLR